jgi:hypothetical protein
MDIEEASIGRNDENNNRVSLDPDSNNLPPN